MPPLLTTTSKMRTIASSLVPLKVLQLQVLKNIDSTLPRPSDPSQFEYKRSTPHAVSCLTHDLNAHLGKVCKAFKSVFLTSVMYKVHYHVKGYSASLLPQVSLILVGKMGSLVAANTFGQTARNLMPSKTTVMLFKAPFVYCSFSHLFTPPIFLWTTGFHS